MRIQVLPLPHVVLGEAVEQPFALVVDQYEEASDATSLEYWAKFGAQCGARSTLVTPATVEVVDRYADAACQFEPADAPGCGPECSEAHTYVPPCGCAVSKTEG